MFHDFRILGSRFFLMLLIGFSIMFHIMGTKCDTTGYVFLYQKLTIFFTCHSVVCRYIVCNCQINSEL